ncbi:MFS transporter [Yokenella regensburgei]|jgi:sugar phosphate permease|uniref:Inner membrane protein yqcE n=1 Tax=Yokenella regensburgei TaxID=158877 RepID=A0AB38FV83_9ENTR|nr:MFS transporter [Yokenella regensburgei]KAF1370284.1 sugar phosphate permease [Yokenella regensburgei]KFD23338.1 YqcE family inner membrane protein [Yokenella regensburgei ATCC 49455]SQA63055.1 Inner membrane protein yqcE [Yokenella regensburgei]SQA96013.1 Inner membrane protein yqcE [Yokenella regensburgei]SUQ04138.1 Inner membrane protein yqcE [Yokenella regensburgei]
MQHSSYRRWITLAIISFSGGVSFDLAYLRYIYQIPMAKFMGFSNTEIGLIMSTFGITAIILYAPSGVIADKFSHRKMITAAMIITGLLGLVMYTYPPLWVMLLIQVAFAVTTILMLWSVSIKAASLLGDHSEQGKIMGWMEGLRGVGVMSLAVFTMWAFSRFAPDDPQSLKTVILIYSVVYLLLGVLCWFFVSDSHKEVSQENRAFRLSDILSVLRISTTWYCSMVIFGVYTIYAILSYSTNYLTEMYGMGLVAASYMGIVINKIFRAICGPLGGLITTYSRVKSPTRVIQILSVVSALALVALLLTNRNPQSVVLGIGLILLLAFTCYASRGLYFACPGEARTPTFIMGTTVGICSVIGFLPDVFVYPVVGYWQDTLPPAEAYRNMWLMGLAAVVMVIVFTVLLFRKIRAENAAPVMAEN